MNIEKLKWLRDQHRKPDNWVKRSCQSCGFKFDVNYVTQPIKDSDLQFCDGCFDSWIKNMSDEEVASELSLR